MPIYLVQEPNPDESARESPTNRPWQFMYKFYSHPEFFAEINRSLGRKMSATPRFIALLRVVGIIEMALAGFAVLSLFFLNW